MFGAFILVTQLLLGTTLGGAALYFRFSSSPTSTKLRNDQRSPRQYSPSNPRQDNMTTWFYCLFNFVILMLIASIVLRIVRSRALFREKPLLVAYLVIRCLKVSCILVYGFSSHYESISSFYFGTDDFFNLKPGPMLFITIIFFLFEWTMVCFWILETAALFVTRKEVQELLMFFSKGWGPQADPEGNNSANRLSTDKMSTGATPSGSVLKEVPSNTQQGGSRPKVNFPFITKSNKATPETLGNEPKKSTPQNTPSNTTQPINKFATTTPKK